MFPQSMYKYMYSIYYMKYVYLDEIKIFIIINSPCVASDPASPRHTSGSQHTPE